MIAAPVLGADQAVTELKAISQAIAKECRAGDFQTLLSHLHPELIRVFGGKANAEYVFLPMTEIVRSGEDYVLGDPQNIRTVGETTFASVPVSLIRSNKHGKYGATTYMLAVREIGQSRWFVIPSSAFSRRRINQISPLLPPDYIWPETGFVFLEAR